jgi:hypothetical protein
VTPLPMSRLFLTLPAMSLRRSILAVALIPLAALLAACSSSGSPHTPTEPRSGSSSASSTPRAASAAATALERWYHDATPPLIRINNAIVDAQHAARHHDLAALRTSCVAMRGSVSKFSAVPDAPDRLARASIQRAMSNFLEAADDCLSGNLDPAGLLVLQGQQAVTQVTRRIDDLA